MWELTDGTRHPTGYWAEELATPHRIFSEAGWSIDITTPGGMAPTAEKSSLGIAGGMPGHRGRVTAYLDAIAADLTHPIPLDRVDETQYDLVFYRAAMGPWWIWLLMKRPATCLPDACDPVSPWRCWVMVWRQSSRQRIHTIPAHRRRSPTTRSREYPPWRRS